MAAFMDAVDGGDSGDYGGAVVADDGDMGGRAMMDLGAPHVALASILLGLAGLKFFSESNLLSLDVAEVKVSFFNIINIGLQAVAFILFLKLGSAALLRRGIIVPGLPDLAGAI